MKIYFAPMEGITGYPFRNAHHRFYSGIDRYYTPFLNLHHTLAFTEKEKRDIAPENNRGVPLVCQVLTNKAEEFLHAAGMLAELGYDEIDLNLGCPSGTVVSKHRGAGFLSDPEALDRFFTDVFAALPGGMRVSVKTRTGIADPLEADEIFPVFYRYPFSELIVHPRVRNDFYRNPPDLDVFEKILQNSPIPVCYNGDIKTVDDFRNIRERFPALQAVMIGRGLLENPGLAQEIRREIISGPSSRFPAAQPVLSPEDPCITEGSAPPGEESGCLPENRKQPDRAEVPEIAASLQDGSHSPEKLSEFHDALLKNYLEEIPEFNNVLFKMKDLWSYLGVSFPGNEKSLKKIRKARNRSEYDTAVRDPAAP